MTLIQSKIFSLGSYIKPFRLLDPVLQKKRNLYDIISKKATLIMFICNHCPYVKHINSELVNLAKYYIHRGVSFIGINSNDITNYPDDSPEQMIKISHKLGYPFPYLFDETQEVAKNYNAVCTPEFFIFNSKNYLVYHGQLDDSRPGNNIPVTGKDIRNVLNAILECKEILNIVQKPSIGCNIKWKK